MSYIVTLSSVLYCSFISVALGLCSLVFPLCAAHPHLCIDHMFWPHAVVLLFFAISWPHMDPCRMDTQMDAVGIHCQPG